MKPAIYKTQVSTPFGLFLIAVNDLEYGAKSTITEIAYIEFKAPRGMLKIGTPVKSNRSILKNMEVIQKTDWAWIKRL